MRTPEDAPTDADALLRYATISSVDLAAARCVVDLDDGVESPPLPWLAPRMGETKVWLPPAVGEQVLLVCPAGEIGSGVIVGALQTAQNPVPIDEPATLIRFADGAILSYDPIASELLIQLPSGATSVLVSDGGIDIVGDLNLDGSLTATGDVKAGDISLENHRHGSVQSGMSQSGGPQ